jgi:hypothetical protein
MVHLLELFDQQISFLASSVLEFLDDRTVDLEDVGLLEVELLRNFLVKVR